MNNYKRRPKTKNEVEKEKNKKKSNIYFSREHEEAIVKYSLSRDQKEREMLFISTIEPVFEQLINKIVFTYKFNLLPNIEDLKLECKAWLTTILDKFDSSKGSKAFSYFSVIIKNWFIHKIKKNNEKIKREVYFEDLNFKNENLEPSIDNDFEETLEKEQFYDNLYAEILDWIQEEDIKPNEKKVLQSIAILLENPEKIEIFNKKAIYLYIRDITGLNTKQIASNLSILKTKYKIFKKSWDDDVDDFC